MSFHYTLCNELSDKRRSRIFGTRQSKNLAVRRIRSIAALRRKRMGFEA